MYKELTPQCRQHNVHAQGIIELNEDQKILFKSMYYTSGRESILSDVVDVDSLRRSGRCSSEDITISLVHTSLYCCFARKYINNKGHCHNNQFPVLRGKVANALQKFTSSDTF